MLRGRRGSGTIFFAWCNLRCVYCQNWDTAGSERVFAFLAREVSADTYINIMDQYRPCYRAGEHPPLNRPLAREEYRWALAAAHRHGLRRLDSRVSWRDYWM